MRITEITLDMFNYWQITNEIVRIGTDNGANMIKPFADFSDELSLDEFDDVITDLDEIHPSISFAAVDNITQELAVSFPDSLLVHLRRDDLLQMYCSIRGERFFKYQLRTSRANKCYRGKGTMLHHKCKKNNTIKCAEVFSEKYFNFSIMNKTRWSSMHQSGPWVNGSWVRWVMGHGFVTHGSMGHVGQ